MRSSVLRYTKKQKEDPEFVIKCPFWEDIACLRPSLNKDESDNEVYWTTQETSIKRTS